MYNGYDGYGGQSNAQVGANQGAYSTAPRSSEQMRQPRRPPPRRRVKSGRIGVIIVVIVAILLIILLVPQIRIPLTELINPSNYREYPKNVEFTVERNIRITNVIDHTVDIPRPEDFSTLQEVISIYGTPSYTTENKYNSDWMVWDDAGNADITITYHMRTETAVWELESTDVMTIEEATGSDSNFQYLVNKYNHEEWKIDPTDPVVISLANQLNTGGTIYDQIKSIFEHLDKNFEYRTVDRAEVKAPSQTIQDGNGDCDDMSFLFNAISRAMGIPSWVELGWLYDQYNNQWIGHAWVALYLPMKVGQSGVVNIDIVNREFLIRGANRFTDWSSDGSFTDENNNGVVDCSASSCEWNLYDYYYMYHYNPASGTTYLSDESTGLEYSESGSVRAKLGGGQSIPSFEVLLLIPVILVAYVVIALSRKNQKR